MTDSNSELVSYRLQKARKTLEDARILADAGRWNPCVNRLYYACFCDVSALLVQEGLSSTKHNGLRSLCSISCSSYREVLRVIFSQ